MKIKKIKIEHFAGFDSNEIELNNKSAVFFGKNGSGKSSMLKAINIVFSRINKEFNVKSIKFEESLINKLYESSAISLDVSLDDEVYELKYSISKYKKENIKFENEEYRVFVDFKDKLVKNWQKNKDVYVFYGLNRKILNSKVKNNYDYKKYTNIIDCNVEFDNLFYWIKDAEDYQNNLIVKNKDFNYKDKNLEAVKNAISIFFNEKVSVYIERQANIDLCFKFKDKVLSYGELSDGEKTVISLFGDIARRLCDANTSLQNPLDGKGIIVIDEIEQHLHPSWQRQILKKLHKIFPNIQFIITTHSPIIISEIDKDYNVLHFYKNNKGYCDVSLEMKLTGYDVNKILERYMDTDSENETIIKIKSKIAEAINSNKFDEAEKLIKKLKQLTYDTNEDVIMLSFNLESKKNAKNK